MIKKENLKKITMHILFGDIGGTKTILGLCNINDGSSEVINEQTYSSNNYGSFYELLNQFLFTCDIDLTLTDSCFAVAGPVIDGTAKITNLPWVIKEHTLIEKYHFRHVKIINDFSAIGYGLRKLGSSDCELLQIGKPNAKGIKTIIGAGTGLGMCMVVPTTDSNIVLPSEIGRTDFAPGDMFSVKLLEDMLSIKPRVACEDVLSGAGLEHIYAYLKHQIHNRASTQALDNNRMPAAQISQVGLSGTNAVAEQAVDQFVKIYATVASNVALVTLPTGGLYIAGGIAPKLVSKLNTDIFLNIFLDNEKMRHVLKTIPVYVILNAKAGLLGASVIATELDTL